MSYCRWSSDDFQCDLYCYEDCGGGFTTHVAARKRVIPADRLPPKLAWPSNNSTKEERLEWAEKYLARNEALMKVLDSLPHEPLGLPFDGQTFNDPDLESFRDRVKALVAAGYRVPADVVESIEEEIQERDKTDSEIMEQDK